MIHCSTCHSPDGGVRARDVQHRTFMHCNMQRAWRTTTDDRAGRLKRIGIAECNIIESGGLNRTGSCSANVAKGKLYYRVVVLSTKYPA